MNFKDPDLKLPAGTIIREPYCISGRYNTYLIKNDGRMIRLDPDGYMWEANCTPVPHYNFFKDTEIVYQPEVPLQVGDKLSTREELASLPKGSVVRYYNYNEEIYRCNGDGRVCVISDDVYHESYKINNLGLHPNCMTILYLPEGK